MEEQIYWINLFGRFVSLSTHWCLDDTRYECMWNIPDTQPAHVVITCLFCMRGADQAKTLIAHNFVIGGIIKIASHIIQCNFSTLWANKMFYRRRNKVVLLLNGTNTSSSTTTVIILLSTIRKALECHCSMNGSLPFFYTIFIYMVRWIVRTTLQVHHRYSYSNGQSMKINSKAIRRVLLQLHLTGLSVFSSVLEWWVIGMSLRCTSKRPCVTSCA